LLAHCKIEQILLKKRHVVAEFCKGCSLNPNHKLLNSNQLSLHIGLVTWPGW